MEDFNTTFMANSTAVFYTLTAFLTLLDAGNSHPNSPTLKNGVKSQFIATSSIGAFARRPGMGYAYAGSKAAVIHLVKQLSTGLVRYHIRVNCFAPGIYPSDMSSVGLLRSNPDENNVLIILGILGRKRCNSRRKYPTGHLPCY